ncbi:MAG: hypothetical protein HQK51_03080 [Oligoflexia bacterium]|nr:hypothetical protein [Oligoflexia bacterium]
MLLKKLKKPLELFVILTFIAFLILFAKVLSAETEKSALIKSYTEEKAKYLAYVDARMIHPTYDPTRPYNLITNRHSDDLAQYYNTIQPRPSPDTYTKYLCDRWRTNISDQGQPMEPFNAEVKNITNLKRKNFLLWVLNENICTAANINISEKDNIKNAINTYYNAVLKYLSDDRDEMQSCSDSFLCKATNSEGRKLKCADITLLNSAPSKKPLAASCNDDNDCISNYCFSDIINQKECRSKIVCSKVIYNDEVCNPSIPELALCDNGLACREIRDYSLDYNGILWFISFGGPAKLDNEKRLIVDKEKYNKDKKGCIYGVATIDSDSNVKNSDKKCEPEKCCTKECVFPPTTRYPLGECKNSDNSVVSPNCKGEGEECTDDSGSECCTKICQNVYENGKMIKICGVPHICSDCIPVGEKANGNQMCCLGLIKNTNNVCTPDMAPPSASNDKKNKNNIFIVWILKSVLNIFVENAMAAKTTTNNVEVGKSENLFTAYSEEKFNNECVSLCDFKASPLPISQFEIFLNAMTFMIQGNKDAIPATSAALATDRHTLLNEKIRIMATKYFNIRKKLIEDGVITQRVFKNDCLKKLCNIRDDSKTKDSMKNANSKNDNQSEYIEVVGDFIELQAFMRQNAIVQYANLLEDFKVLYNELKNFEYKTIWSNFDEPHGGWSQSWTCASYRDPACIGSLMNVIFGPDSGYGSFGQYYNDLISRAASAKSSLETRKMFKDIDEKMNLKTKFKYYPSSDCRFPYLWCDININCLRNYLNFNIRNPSICNQRRIPDSSCIRDLFCYRFEKEVGPRGKRVCDPDFYFINPLIPPDILDGTTLVDRASLPYYDIAEKFSMANAFLTAQEIPEYPNDKMRKDLSFFNDKSKNFINYLVKDKFEEKFKSEAMAYAKKNVFGKFEENSKYKCVNGSNLDDVYEERNRKDYCNKKDEHEKNIFMFAEYVYKMHFLFPYIRTDKVAFPPSGLLTYYQFAYDMISSIEVTAAGLKDYVQDRLFIRARQYKWHADNFKIRFEGGLASESGMAPTPEYEENKINIEVGTQKGNVGMPSYAGPVITEGGEGLNADGLSNKYGKSLDASSQENYNAALNKAKAIYKKAREDRKMEFDKWKKSVGDAERVEQLIQNRNRMYDALSGKSFFEGSKTVMFDGPLNEATLEKEEGKSKDDNSKSKGNKSLSKNKQQDSSVKNSSTVVDVMNADLGNKNMGGPGSSYQNTTKTENASLKSALNENDAQNVLNEVKKNKNKFNTNDDDSLFTRISKAYARSGFKYLLSPKKKETNALER